MNDTFQNGLIVGLTAAGKYLSKLHPDDVEQYRMRIRNHLNFLGFDLPLEISWEALTQVIESLDTVSGNIVWSVFQDIMDETSIKAPTLNMATTVAFALEGALIQGFPIEKILDETDTQAPELNIENQIDSVLILNDAVLENLNSTSISFMIPEAPSTADDITVEVIDPNGVEHPVVPTTINEGDMSAHFNFVTQIDPYELGEWFINDQIELILS